MKGEILILGVGNILLGDEGIGVHVVNALSIQKDGMPSGVDIEDGGTAGFDLAGLMKGRKKIIIIDTLISGDAPGSVSRLWRDELKYTGNNFSTHNPGILHAIGALEMSGETPVIEFIGIVPETVGTVKLELSEKVKMAVPEVLKLIKESVAEGAAVN